MAWEDEMHVLGGLLHAAVHLIGFTYSPVVKPGLLVYDLKIKGAIAQLQVPCMRSVLRNHVNTKLEVYTEYSSIYPRDELLLTRVPPTCSVYVILFKPEAYIYRVHVQ